MSGSTEFDRRANTGLPEDLDRRGTFNVAWLADLEPTASGTVEPQWIDAMGHMNVMWYTHIFSRANLGFLTSIGMDLRALQQQQRGVFALETHLRYHAEALVGHGWQIHTRVIARSARCIHLMHFMSTDEGARLAATCEHMMAHADTSARCTAVLPAAYADPIDALVHRHGRLAWRPPLCGSMGVRSQPAQ